METALIRTLLNRDFYKNNKRMAKSELFNGELQKIKNHLDKTLQEYDRDLTPAELEATFLTNHPHLTTSQRSVYRGLFNKIDKEQPLGEELASNVFKTLWRQSFAEKTTDLAFQMHNGDLTSLTPLKDLLEEHENDFLPNIRVKTDRKDLEYILENNDNMMRWGMNIPGLHDMWRGVSPGLLIVGAARPNTGKTSSIAYMCSGAGGFIEQGAKVVIFANEEKCARITARHITALTGLSVSEIKRQENFSKVKTMVDKWKDNYDIVDATGQDLDWLEAHIKLMQPDIVVCDMADKFLPDGKFAAAHEALKTTYIRFRIMAKEYNCALFAMSQLSAEAEGKVIVNQSMLEGSKTGKAAEADLMFCLTKNPMVEGQDEDDNQRHWCIVKNKITGRHGAVHNYIDPFTATFSA